jgi:hypothetical protein
MKCRRVQHVLPDYIGDELSARKRQQIDQHLAECPDCRAALDALHEVWDGLAQQPHPHKDERFWSDLTKGVMTEIKRKRPMPADEKRPSLFPGWRVLLPATAAAMAIIVGVIASKGVLWGPHEGGRWTARSGQKALVEAAPDLSFGPLAAEAEDPLEQAMTLKEISLVAEGLNPALQPADGKAITDLVAQLFNGDDLDLYGQLEGLTEEELETFSQLLSAQYPYS